jgi:hypothetical protein
MSDNPMVSAEGHPIKFAKCKRGSDRATTGQECDGNLAEILSPPGSNIVHFRCHKCKHAWIIPVGGTSPI